MKNFISRQLFAISIFILFIVASVFAAIYFIPKADELALADNEITLIGTYRVITIDDFKNRTMRHEYHLEVNDQDYILKFADEHNHTDISPSSQVKVVGTIEGNIISVKSIEPYKKEVAGVKVVKDQVPTTGKRRLAILVNQFNDSEKNQAQKDETINFVKENATDNQKSVREFYKSVSYGKLDLSIDVYGLYTVPFASTGSCDYDDWSGASQQKAREANVNLDSYDFISYTFLDTKTCDAGGRGELIGTESWVFESFVSDSNTFKFVLAHEFGHNLGLHHANSLICKNSVVVQGGEVSPPDMVPSGRTVPLAELCRSGEYGDPFDVMGYSYTLNHFNSYEKDLLNWFEPNNVKTVTASGTYTIKSLEAVSNDPQTIKLYRYGIPVEGLKDTNSNFYIEFRGTDGFNPRSENYKPVGVAVRLAPTKDSSLYDRKSQIITVAPEKFLGNAPGPYSGFILEAGKSVSDSLSGVTITTVSVTSTEAVVKVDIPSTQPPKLSFTSQLTGKKKVKQKYTVKTSVLDSDSDAEVTFYTAYNGTDTGFAIESCEGIKVKQSSKPKTISCTFPIEPWYANANNEIYIYAQVKDSRNAPSKVYAKGKLQLIPNQPPTVTLDNPFQDGETLSLGSSYTIRYSLSDPDDKITAAFSLYKISDGEQEPMVYNIKECSKKPETTAGRCQFSTQPLENGSYVISINTDDPAGNYAYVEAPGILTVKADENLNKPTELIAKRTAGRVSVDWKDNSSNESGFEIWRIAPDDPNNYSYKRIGKVKTNTTVWPDASAKNDLEYFYKIRAYRTKGKITSYSEFSPSKPISL